MKKSALTVALTVLSFSLGVIADETLKPDGWSWQRINYGRQLGFVEGFVKGSDDGSTMQIFKPACGKDSGRVQGLDSICILSRLRGGTYTGTDADKTVETVNKLYAAPQNLPIDWGHAVIISQAMVSGVPVSERDLEVIRKDDATPPKPMSKKELRDIPNSTPPAKQ
jgi:hypothetical protein